MGNSLVGAAIAHLKVYLETLENNAAVNEREGFIDQARQERENARDVVRALVILEAVEKIA